MAADEDPVKPGDRNSRGRSLRTASTVLGAAVLAFALYDVFRSSATDPSPRAESTSNPVATEPATEDRAWTRLSRQEETILRLDENLADLAFSIRNLEFPDARTRRQFLPYDLLVEDIGVDPLEPTHSLEGISGAVSTRAPAPLQREQTSRELRLWRTLLDDVEAFDFAALRIRRGELLQGSTEAFEADVQFKATARLHSGAVVALKAAPKVRWRLISGTDPKERQHWIITAWRTGPVTRIEAPEPIFREVLAEALADEASLERARDSIHERLIAASILSEQSGERFEPPHEFFAYTAVFQHPGLSVVDIDRDGFDDFYVTTRWDRNQFFRNTGRGGFEEISAELGLDIDSHSNAALFADFDNDGDPDLFVSRSLAPSVYLVNDDGRFLDRTAEFFAGGAPAMASSASAADYDRDGLLDLYVSTYAAQLDLERIRELASPQDFARFARQIRRSEGSQFLNMPGPPNILFRNTGSGFERVETSSPIADLRNTYQATWADYDQDGDPDLYIANDFAPDKLIRNDGEGGFSDVSAEMGISRSGFGMGVTWGDYDRDGREDLYVANMYSKAGNRVTDALEYLDPDFNQAAQGNYLYRNASDGFRLVSGSDASDLHVNRAGWAWGTHFLDADNDGYLDLFALAGFYTAPREVEEVGDS